MTPSTNPILVVTITQNGKNLGATTTDGIKCQIVANANSVNCALGDRWTAKAVKGRAKGEKGPSKIELLSRVAQGDVTSVPGHWIDQINLRSMQVYLQSGLHVLLVGPPGCGKTTLPMRLAAARGWEFLLVDGSQMLTPRELFGADSSKARSSVFLKSELVLWLEKAKQLEGGSGEITHLLLLDELNRAQGRASNGLLGLLGPLRRTSLPTVEGNLVVTLPRNVAVVSTANIGREYSGTSALDRALEDRHAPISLGYAPPENTAAILKNDARFSAIPLEHIKYIAEAASVLYEQFQSRKSIQFPPSFRGVEAALALRGAGFTLDECVERGFLTRHSEVERDDLKAALKIRQPQDASGAGAPT